MNPKDPNNFIAQVAKDLDLDEKLVKDVVSLYWKEVKRLVTEMEHYNIKLENLGNLEIKPWKLEKLYRKYENLVKKYKGIIDSGKKITMARFAIMKDYESKMAKIENVKKIIDIDLEKKERKKKAKNEAINKRNLEK